MTDFLPQIFLEALHKASIIPLGSEPAFYALKAFGEQPMQMPVLAAVAGALLGHAFNWWIGTQLKKMHTKKNWKPAPDVYEKIRGHFLKTGIYLLVLAWLPFCNLLTLAAGFFGVPPKKTLLFILIGLVWNYGRVLAV
ncbi:MAG: VTT domain-containing protein [Alphaproteobacteria bacterium]|nr:VTT domain-containing protein [Alphaproteobacteria bacterium]